MIGADSNATNPSSSLNFVGSVDSVTFPTPSVTAVDKPSLRTSNNCTIRFCLSYTGRFFCKVRYYSVARMPAQIAADAIAPCSDGVFNGVRSPYTSLVCAGMYASVRVFVRARCKLGMWVYAVMFMWFCICET